MSAKRTDPVWVQLDFDFFEALHAGTRELRLASERARAQHQLRYGDELELLAERLNALIATMNQRWRENHLPLTPRR